MPDSQHKEVKNNLPLPTLQQSLQTIHEFLNAFPIEHLEEHSWELISSAFSSEAVDTWTLWQKSSMLQLYKHLSKLRYALATVDNQLWQLGYGKGEELQA